MTDIYTSHVGEPIERPRTRCSLHNDAEPSNIDGSSSIMRASRAVDFSSANRNRSTDSFSSPLRLTRTSPNLTISDIDSTAGPVVAVVSEAAELKRRSSCGSTTPLIEIVSPEELPKRAPATPPKALQPPADHPLSRKRSAERRSASRGSLGRKGSVKNVAHLTTVSMVYNQYGELVEEKALLVSPKSEDLNVTQLLRVIRKGYHHEVRVAVLSPPWILPGVADGRDSFEPNSARSSPHVQMAKPRFWLTMESGRTLSPHGTSSTHPDPRG